jgi:hypothetical protein
MGRCKQLLNDMLTTGYVKIDLDEFVRQVPLADLSQFGKNSGRYQFVTVRYESRVKILKNLGFRIRRLAGLSYSKF